MTNQEAANLGREAEQAMGVLNKACDDVIAALQKTLASLPYGSNDQVLTTHSAIVTTNKIRGALAAIIGGGKMAEAALVSEKLMKGDQ